MKTEQYATKRPVSNDEIKKEITKHLETNDNQNNFTKSMGCSKSSSKKEFF